MFWTHVFNYHSEHASKIKRIYIELKGTTQKKTNNNFDLQRNIVKFCSVNKSNEKRTVLLKQDSFTLACSLSFSVCISFSLYFSSKRYIIFFTDPPNTRTKWQLHNQKLCSYIYHLGKQLNDIRP